MADKNSWSCKQCKNSIKTGKVYCGCCGKFKTESTIFRIFFTIFTLIVSGFYIPYMIKWISDIDNAGDWSKLVVILFVSAPFLFLLYTVTIKFIYEYIKTIPLKENPDFLSHSDPEKRVEAISSCSDEEKLKTILKKDKDRDVRRAVVKRLNNPDLIEELAKKDKDPDVRGEALRKVYDEDKVVEIVKNDKSPLLRKKVISILVSQKKVADFALEDENTEVRVCAVKKLNLQKVLEDIAFNDQSPKVRLEAVKKIKNQSIIEQIANSDPDPEVENEALIKIGQEGITDELISNRMKEPIVRFINGLSIATPKKKLDEMLTNLLFCRGENWYKDTLVDLLNRVAILPKSGGKLDIMLDILKKIGTIDRDRDVENLYLKVINQNQNGFNRLIESLKDPLEHFPIDTKAFIKTAYTGKYRF